MRNFIAFFVGVLVAVNAQDPRDVIPSPEELLPSVEFSIIVSDVSLNEMTSCFIYCWVTNACSNRWWTR